MSEQTQKGYNLEPGICALCQKEKELVKSHIVPHFVFRWLRKSSISKLRSLTNINVPIQDGIKIPLLCKECEGLISKWESEFAEKIFYPFHNLEYEDSFNFEYQEWCLRFLISLSWRNLDYHIYRKGNHPFYGEQEEIVGKAYESWRDFLLGNNDDTGKYVHHLIPLNMISKVTRTKINSTFLNRYILRSYDLTVSYSKRGVFVYSKIGRLVSIGIVQDKNSNIWNNTRIRKKAGRITSCSMKIPYYLMEFINSRANGVGERLSGLSENQKRKIEKNINENWESFLDSEVYRSISQDNLLFGPDIFSKQDNILEKQNTLLDT